MTSASSGTSVDACAPIAVILPFSTTMTASSIGSPETVSARLTWIASGCGVAVLRVARRASARAETIA